MNDTSETNQSQQTMLNQPEYEPSAYTDSDWEIVDDEKVSNEFFPLELEVVPQEGFQIDPMFADYGGNPKKEEGRRWHLPAELSIAGQLAQAESDAEADKSAQASIDAAKLEEIKKEAFESGRAQATQEAAQIQAQRQSQLESKLSQILNDLHAQTKHEISKIEKQAVELSLSIARKIITFAVEINPEYIVKILEQALTQASSSQVYKVRVSPEDFEFIEVEGVSKALKAFEGTWKFEADPTVKSGCVVETAAGQIDYDLDQAWQRVSEQVLRLIK